MFARTSLAVCAFLLVAAGRLSADPSHFGKKPDPLFGFRRLASLNIPDGGSAEIVAATPDGKTLVYSNAVGSTVGIVNIANPARPTVISELAIDGQPTSVAVTPDGAFALAAVITTVLEEGMPPAITPGKLLFIRIADFTVVGSVALGTWPDSVRTTMIGGNAVALVAIENQPIIVDEMGNWVDDDAPGNPGDISEKGFIQVVTLDLANPETSVVVDVPIDTAVLTALGSPFPEDPQPEYIAIHGTKAAVTLQENNAFAILDIADPAHPAVEKILSLGKVADRPADLTVDETISFTETYPGDISVEDVPLAGLRMSDAIAWNAAGTALVTADEGELDFTGGRGWSIRRPDGTFVWDDGGSLEQIAVSFGQYPEDRSDGKGIETEGIEVGTFGGREIAFVSSERGGFIAAYDISRPDRPQFIQFLPAGIRPESILAIPSRDLVIVGNEGDDGAGSINIYKAMTSFTEVLIDIFDRLDRPELRSNGLKNPWAALSGLASDPVRSNRFYAVPDNALISSIFSIDVVGPVGQVSIHARIRKDGKQAAYDLEGIANDYSIAAHSFRRGFWLASEGNAAFGAENYHANLLVQVDSGGKVLQEVRLPEEIDPSTEQEVTDGKITSNGFEGVAISDNGRHLLAAIQRPFAKEPKVDDVLHTRIGRYDLRSKKWEFFLYPLDAAGPAGGTIGLSEIIHLGRDIFAVIERDNQLGSLASVKKVYAFSLRGVEPFSGVVAADSDLEGHVIEKFLLSDVLDDFQPFEKVEGLAVASDGRLWVVLDNDGGFIENRLVRLGRPGLPRKSDK